MIVLKNDNEKQEEHTKKTIDRNRYIFKKQKTQDNRVICKVRKIQHQNPEFGHT
jgi:hypothetical protein